MPKATLNHITNRFGHSGFREDCELLAEIVRGLGEERFINHRNLANGASDRSGGVIGLLGLLDRKSLPRYSRCDWRNGHVRCTTVACGSCRPFRRNFARSF